MRPDALGIVGLGAIGGSVAWSAARAGIRRIIGYSPLPVDQVAALKAGAITEVAERPQGLLRAADFVVLAAPPAATLALLRELRDDLLAKPIICTDVTSVKGPVVGLAERLGLQSRFAGSHPLAGTHESGFAAARASLLTDAVVYVTPLRDGEQAAHEVADFWATVCGAAPVLWEARAHDAAVAWTSHLPQAVASALAATLDRAGPKGVRYGPGARDTTRLAASNPALWHDVLLLNRDFVLETLEAIEGELGQLRQALATGNGADLVRWLEAGCSWRRRIEP